MVGEVEILLELNGKVWVLPAVKEELRHPEESPEGREWVGSEPRWFGAQATVRSCREKWPRLLRTRTASRAKESNNSHIPHHYKGVGTA